MSVSPVYIAMADAIDAALVDGQAAVDELLAMKASVEGAANVSSNKKRALIDAVNSLGPKILYSKVNGVPHLRSTIIGMNNAIISEFGSIDNFLSSEDERVKENFADLSRQLGYTISDDNVGAVLKVTHVTFVYFPEDESYRLLHYFNHPITVDGDPSGSFFIGNGEFLESSDPDPGDTFGISGGAYLIGSNYIAFSWDNDPSEGNVWGNYATSQITYNGTSLSFATGIVEAGDME